MEDSRPCRQRPATVLGNGKQEINTRATSFPADGFRFLPVSKRKEENDVGVLCSSYTSASGDLAGRGHSFQRCPEGDLCKACAGRTSPDGSQLLAPVWGLLACPHHPSRVTRALQLSVYLLLLL